ncbi:MAG: hypothetical protein IKL53_10995 [Lachnospiraceae bacterium]|nr:hypothetical protein [Lachnospiraceae bacterium]MBR3600385.1 hypothetical protein [Lachnospiraceae bacterium]
MSQAKVDKYKEEKKNRAKNIKKAKVKKVVTVLICAALVGVLIGFPLGRHMYNVSYEKRMENATVSAGLYDYWMSEYMYENYGSLFETTDTASSTDSNYDELIDELSSDSDNTIVIDTDDLKDGSLEEIIQEELSE